MFALVSIGDPDAVGILWVPTLVTARRRHVGLSSSARTWFSTVARIVPAKGLASSSSVLKTSIVQ
jgi:hypothetical protein